MYVWANAIYISRLTVPAAPTTTMDGACSPHHRIMTPPSPALVPTGNVSRLRALFTSSSGQESPQIPQRKRSVRFEGVGNDQLDGQPDEQPETKPLRASDESQRSSVSQRFSDQMESLSAKLKGNAGTQTIVHRASQKQKPTVPFLNTKADSVLSRTAEDGNASPSTTSSLVPSAHNTTWSPASTASTAATSWTSPRSSAPTSRNRYTPEDCQNNSKSISGGVAEEGVLPPIQEDSGRFLMIPVQEVAIETEPSVATVENVAAAKVYLETYFQKLILDPSSPRSIRRRKFEQRMADLGFSHDERLQARQQ